MIHNIHKVHMIHRGGLSPREGDLKTFNAVLYTFSHENI